MKQGVIIVNSETGATVQRNAHYQRLIWIVGRPHFYAAVFAPEAAEQLATSYRARGIPAAVVPDEIYNRAPEIEDVSRWV